MAGLPNFLSCLRLGLVPGLLVLAYAGEREFFLRCLVIAVVTDALDGFLARRLHLTSALGAKLDSIADCALALAMPPCAWWLRPEVLREQLPAILAALGFYAVAQGAGLWKFGRLPGYHTWAAKIVSTFAMVGFVAIFAGAPSWILRVLAPLVIVASLETILITLVLREWQANIPSVWHVWRRRKTPSD